MKKELIQRLLKAQSTSETPSNTSETPSTINETPSTTNETPSTTNETPSTTNETPSTINETPSTIKETPSTIKETPSVEEGMECEASDSESSESSEGSDSSAWELDTFTGFGGLQSVKDVDEYGRETDSVASQRCEVSVLTTFAAGEAQPSKAKLLSLDGLLEYTPKDTREKIFEVSLLGEVFKDMLLARFGQAIGELLRQTQAAMKEAEAAVLEAREAREAREAKEAKEAEAKEAKEGMDVEMKAEEAKDSKEGQEEGDAETNDETHVDQDATNNTNNKETPAETKNDAELPKETPKETPREAGKEAAKEVQAAKKSVPIAMSRELFIACRYFDGKNRGELSQEQLLHILLNSGAVCCKSEGEKLVTYVLDRDSLRYRKLYNKSCRVSWNKQAMRKGEEDYCERFYSSRRASAPTERRACERRVDFTFGASSSSNRSASSAAIAPLAPTSVGATIGTAGTGTWAATGIADCAAWASGTDSPASE